LHPCLLLLVPYSIANDHRVLNSPVWLFCLCTVCSLCRQALDSAGSLKLGNDPEFQAHVDRLVSVAMLVENIKEHITHYENVIGGMSVFL
jgi:hypothetical protein